MRKPTRKTLISLATDLSKIETKLQSIYQDLSDLEEKEIAKTLEVIILKLEALLKTIPEGDECD